ncbi:MAG TPA: thioredoxin fold domain-containing protein, partial [Flavobacteriales bacterium]|nr:thioredoxin fold domain-containing protein [Flavobacteriales bacterium]
KRVFVKIYTDWCGPCKTMDKKVLSKARITEPLARYYYSVAFNAEQTGNVNFKDSVFVFNPNLGPGTHNLAFHLGKDAGHMYYPTIVILDEKLDVLYHYPGYMNVANLEEALYLYKDLQK